MKRQSRNYIDNCLRDIRKGVEKVEQMSRQGTEADFNRAATNVRLEIELMLEGVNCIEAQQELEV